MKWRAKLKSTWNRFKAWVYGVLVSIGLIASPLLIADADDINLFWTNATQDRDGNPMPVEDLNQTVVMHQMFPLGGSLTGIRIYTEIARIPATQEIYPHIDLPNGIHCYVVYHVHINGISGGYSDEYCKPVDVRVPGNPTGLSST